jgi:hypothetical protein
MTRSLWIGALAGALVCTAPGRAQVQQEKTVTVREAGKPPAKCRVLKCWRDKDGNKVCQVQAIDGGEMMTIQEPAASEAGRPGGAQIFHWHGADAPPPGAPPVPANALLVARPEARDTLWSRLFGPKETKTTPPPSARPVQTAPPPVAPPEQAAAGPAPSRDWRESWGKVDRWGQPDTKAAAGPPAGGGTTVVAQAVQTVGSSDQGLPHAVATADDPLQNPAAYVKGLPPVVGEPARGGPNPLVAGSGGSPRAVTTAEPPMVGGPPVPSAATKVCCTPTPSAATRVCCTTAPSAALAPTPAPAQHTGLLSGLWDHPTTPAAAPAHPTAAPAGPAGATPPVPRQVPLGMRSIAAVRSPRVEKVDVVGRMVVVDGKASMVEGRVMGPSVPVTAPNAFTLSMPGGSVPAMQAMGGGMMMPGAPMMGSGPAAEGLANAFTNGGTSRPIPAEAGLAYQGHNAFQEGGMNVMPRQPRMLPPGMMPPGYYPQVAMAPPPGYYPQMAYAPPPPTAGLVRVLHDSLLPSEREMAADQLAHYDWHGQPHLVAALVEAARADPAATVRASCVHALAKMKANTLPVVQAVQGLKKDPDVRVRQEVDQALAVFAAP